MKKDKPLKPVILGAALKRDPLDDRDYQFSSVPDGNRIIKMSASLPTKKSWRNEMSAVKYQGNLGSCVGFSVCALKEWQEQKEHEAEVAAGKKDHREQKEYNLSEAWVYWNAKKIDPWPGQEGCHDDKTEILTDKGWKLFSSLDGTEKVASINPENESLYFCAPSAYYKKEYVGDILHIAGRGINCVVTPDHNMWVSQRKRDIGTREYKNFEMIKAKNLGYHSKLVCSLKWNGKNPENMVIGDKKIDFEKWMKFFGLYIAEGSSTHTENNPGHYIVQIAVSKNSKKMKEIRKIIEDVPFNFFQNNNSFRCYSKDLYQLLSVFGKSYEKYIPDYVKESSPDMIDCFLYGYRLGDGHLSKDGRTFYYTSSKKLVDGVQELIIKTGKWCSVKGRWRKEKHFIGEREIIQKHMSYQIIVRQKKVLGISKKNISKKAYNGYVYCVEVPSHIILTRRNGVLLIAGNTNFRSALKVVQKIGVPIEQAWPYSDDGLKIGEPKKWAHLIARWSTIDSYWRVANYIPDIKRALNEGPILFGMTCFEEMYGNLIGGVIPYPSKPNEVWSYHAVLAVGYDDEKEQICIKNSWSRFWGDEGYGYIPYRYVEDHCWDHWAVKDVSVTADMLKGARKLIE